MADNLVHALLLLGDWDAAEAEFIQATDTDDLTAEFLIAKGGMLAALRGDAGTAQSLLAQLRDMRDSEDPQDNATIAVLRAFTAAASANLRAHCDTPAMR